MRAGVQVSRFTPIRIRALVRQVEPILNLPTDRARHSSDTYPCVWVFLPLKTEMLATMTIAPSNMRTIPETPPKLEPTSWQEEILEGLGKTELQPLMKSP